MTALVAPLRSIPLHRLRAFVLVFFMAFGFVLSDAALAQQPMPASNASAESDAASPSQYEVLADLLADEQTREQLIGQLRELAIEGEQTGDETTSEARPATGPSWVATGSVSVAVRLQEFALALRNDIWQSWRVIRSLGDPDSNTVQRVSSAQSALIILLLTLITAAVVYRLCRIPAQGAFARLNAWATRPVRPEPVDEEQLSFAEPEQITGSVSATQALHASRRKNRRLGRKLIASLVAWVVDVAVTLVAALAGYLVVVGSGASAQQGAIFAMQFLAAFVAIEVVKAFSRGVFATRYEQLRLLPVTSETAQYWNRWVVILISVVGYGLLVVVPIVKAVLAPAVGQLLGAILMILVYVYAVRVVWKNRKAVSDELTRSAEHASTAVFGTLMRITARSWAWLALAYLTVLLLVSLADQQHALSFMGSASLQTLVAILVGMFISLVLQSWMGRRLHLPERWNQAFPLLERRLNSYVPATLQAIRIAVFIIVLLVVLDAWRIFDLSLWLSSSQGQAAINTILRVAIILLIAAATWTILASIIEHRLSSSHGKRLPTEREKTLLMLFRNALAIVICTMTVLVVLSQVGIDIAPLIAGAGVVGLAIGFGAQKLVQDVITGIFIQLENGLNQNDVVELVGLFGTVEKLTIRSVVIRTLDGGYHLIPFSSIDKVSNHTREYGYHYGEYTIGLRESIDEVIEQMHAAFEALKQDPEVTNEIIDDISIPGVTSFNQQGYTIRVLIKTTPGMQWAVQRSFNRLLKMRFDAAGIELPYPHTVLHFGRDKNGFAQPVDMRMVDAVAHREGQPEPAPGQTLRPLSGAS